MVQRKPILEKPMDIIVKRIYFMMNNLMKVITLPLRLMLSHEQNNRICLPSLKDERIEIVKSRCRGKLLDIGCGDNQLVAGYGDDGIGVDVFDWNSIGRKLIVKDTSDLPFDDKSFDTITFVACLNHIPNRFQVVAEARRVLADDGRIIITMLNPYIGWVRHKLAWWDTDQYIRGMMPGEVYGLTKTKLLSILENNDMKLSETKRFIFGLNNLYVFQKVVR